MREKTAESQYVGAFPKYFIETMVLVFVILIISINEIFFIKTSANALPLLITFAIGSQKLLPLCSKSMDQSQQ